MDVVNRLLMTEEDCEAAIGLYNGDWSRGTHLGYSIDELKSMFKDAPQCRAYGTFNNNTLIAWALIYDCHWWGYLDIFYVDLAYRKQGIAARLLDFIKNEHLLKWHCIETHIMDDQTLRFFKKQGFNICDQQLSWGVVHLKSKS